MNLPIENYVVVRNTGVPETPHLVSGVKADACVDARLFGVKPP